MIDVDAILETEGGLFQTTTPDGEQTFTYRLLSMKEYKIFAALRDGGLLPPFRLYEQIFSRCFLGEIIPENSRAGIIFSIGQFILWLSGDCENDTLKEDISSLRLQNPLDSLYTYEMAVITSIFPYKLEDIEKWSRLEFHRKFVIAENLMIKQRGEEVTRLDLAKIQSGGEKAKKPKGSAIDFERENASIRSAMGAGNVEELEAEMGDLRARTQALTQAQAQRLQQRQGR